MTYEEFLKNKIVFKKDEGFEIDEREINSYLKDHQKNIVKWAVKKGRAGIFASFGLGKTKSGRICFDSVPFRGQRRVFSRCQNTWNKSEIYKKR